MSFVQSIRTGILQLFRFELLYLAISLLALVILLFATGPWGIGITQDSVFYFSAAQNYLEGEGISWTGGGGLLKPLIHFPPIYPLALAGIKALLGDINSAATWINALLYGSNVLIVGVVVRKATKSWKAGTAGALIALFSPHLLNLHLNAMSEPLYLVLGFASFVFLILHIEQAKARYIILAGISSSLAVLTRYVGFSVIVTGILLLLLWFPDKWSGRVREALRYTIISILPVLFWYLRNFSLTGSFTNRTIAVHPITRQTLTDGLNTFSTWFLSDSFSQDLRIAIALIILGGIGVFIISVLSRAREGNGMRDPDGRRIIRILALHGIVYSSLLVVSISFVDASTRLENRILSPLYLITLTLVVICVTWLISKQLWRHQMAMQVLGILLTVVVLGMSLPRHVTMIKDMRSEGSGFNARSWQESEIISILHHLSSGATVYSNEAFAVLYLTEIPARWIPEKYDPVKASERESFEVEINKMRERLGNPNSALVVFHQGYLKPGMPSLEEIMEGLVLAHESRDGIILISPENEQFWPIP